MGYSQNAEFLNCLWKFLAVINILAERWARKELIPLALANLSVISSMPDFIGNIWPRLGVSAGWQYIDMTLDDLASLTKGGAGYEVPLVKGKQMQWMVGWIIL
jgi:hypothetical protein